MTDKPILFSGPMVRALLERRKTQTRRVLKIRGHDGFFQFGPSDTPGHDWHFRRKDHVWEDYTHEHLLARLPIQKGDRLWVRETFAISGIGWGKKPSKALGGRVHFAADPDHGWKDYWGNWHPSIHMPRWASRITLTVTDVRVQRLQEISREDAIAEGLKKHPILLHGSEKMGCDWTYDGCNMQGSPVSAFAHLWNSINGAEAWDANPWVAAYTFEVVKQNIDQIKDAA